MGGVGITVTWMELGATGAGWGLARDAVSVHRRGSRCQTDHTQHLGQCGFFLDLNCTYSLSPAYHESAVLNGDVTCFWVKWVTEWSFSWSVKWQVLRNCPVITWRGQEEKCDCCGYPESHVRSHCHHRRPTCSHRSPRNWRRVLNLLGLISPHNYYL